MSIEDWIPPTLTGLPRAEDRKLTGFRLPLTEAQVRALAARPFLKCEFGDANWFRNVLTMNSMRAIEHADEVSAWENEGGR